MSKINLNIPIKYIQNYNISQQKHKEYRFLLTVIIILRIEIIKLDLIKIAMNKRQSFICQSS